MQERETSHVENKIPILGGKIALEDEYRTIDPLNCDEAGGETRDINIYFNIESH